MSADNVILNSCQYAPVYFIEDPGVSQASSYVLAANNQSVEKPASESLKRFYENSGKLESNLTVADNTLKTSIIRKNDINVVGNNLKLASFLLPKCETKNELNKPVLTPVNSVVLKPVYIANNPSVNNPINSPSQIPKIDVNSRLVKLKDIPNIVRSQYGKILPKIKPKENSTSNKHKEIAVQAAPPVQLIKFGETYHSLNQLSTDQMKIVNHALKMLNNNHSNPPESAYDPATNTKFIYKIMSQKDFAEENKIVKQVSTEIKKEPIKIEKQEIIDEEEEPKVTLEAKVTRSGRVVKLPKNIIVEDSPSKPKRRPISIVACLQCNSQFSSPQRLHRHYENHPSHIPSNLHNNLFHCLVAMVAAGPQAERAGILLRQLQLLVDRLRACVPCLLRKDQGMENINVVSDDIGKLLGINPGNYNLNMEALNCVKDEEGYCSHNPRPQINIPDIKPHIILENIENGLSTGKSNISKVNFQERRPTILRKVECRKQKLEQSSHNVNGKKMKLSQSISIDKNSNSLELDDLVAILSDTTKTDNKETKFVDKVLLNDQNKVKQETVPEKIDTLNKPAHIQFHSAHFDIRSSPIKPTSTVFRKFQINPEKMTKYIEIIRPIKLNQMAQGAEMTNNVDTNINAQEIFSDTNMITSKDTKNYIEIIRPIKLNQMAQGAEMTNNVDTNINAQEIFSDTNMITSKDTENLNYASKNWCENSNLMEQNAQINSHADNFMKPNAALLHVKNELVLKHVNSDSEVANKVTNNNSLLNTNISTKVHVEHDSQLGVYKATNQTNAIKPSILIEPLILSQNNPDLASDKISNQTDSDDFIKSDILDQALLDNQHCKVIDEITNRSDDFLKSNILIEPALIHSQDAKIDKFANQADSLMASNVCIDPTLPHGNLDDGNSDCNEIDVDLNSSQRQSIISFLESLGNELAYTDTETDSGNNIDFQLDLFSFNNSE